MSRRRSAAREGALPDWLAEYVPELWAADLSDPLEVHYFGRFPWTAAREEWLRGGNPKPVQRDSGSTFPIPE